MTRQRWTDEESEIIRTSIAKRGKSAECSWCSGTDMHISDGFAWFPLYGSIERMGLIGDGMPCAGVICGDCGHVEWFNLLSIGLDRFVK